jgi:predicted alpha/beta hydrolase
MMRAAVETHKFPALDGIPLEGSLFATAGAPRATVVVGSAMGVPRRLYEAFAAYLAEDGLATLTFDYRGIGGSLTGSRSLRGNPATLSQWGEQDIGGALSAMTERWPGVPRLFVGHSVGGQILGLAPGKEHLSGALLVASQSGYWRLWAPPRSLLMAMLWHAGIPAFTAAFGYLPMKRLGGGEDLPMGVARQWAAWGRDPGYVLSYAGIGASGYREMKVPIRAYSISDDSYAPRRTIETLLGYYERAPSEIKVVSPSDAGMKAIGHFGYFSSRFKDSLWAEPRAWLIARAESA